ncbi:MAG: cyanophycinase [Planctomycetota bacterium]|jgi:cyanophycinase
MVHLHRTVLATIAALLTGLASVRAQYDSNWPEPLTPLVGAVFMGGGGDLPEDALARFVQMAGGDEAKLVVLSTSKGAVVPAALQHAMVVKVMAADDAQVTQAAAKLAKATGVWLLADSGQQFADTFRGSAVETQLHMLVHRNGVLGANGDLVTALAATRIAGGEVHATLAAGLDLVPGVVIGADYQAALQKNRLLGVLASKPQLVGLGIEVGTMMVLHNRFFDVFGEGSAYACLAANEHLPLRVERIHPDLSPSSQRRPQRNAPQRGRRRGAAAPERVRRYRPRRLEDLMAMTRDAMARTQVRFPSLNPPTPNVTKGSLMIVGGGGSPAGFNDKFMELAGGKDALLLYIPCTEGQQANAERVLASWRRAGATNVDFIHTKDRHEADTSKEIHDKLRRAGGLFFGGGRQWNLVDSWQHTESHRLMHEVLARGGVIAGSSAGASIQGSYMARGNSLGNVDSMAPGYDTGLGFLTGVAIDQHFSQRGRHPDMTKLVNRYPQLLGIGLDEASSIVVQGTVATCFSREGRNVHFYDRNLPVVPGQPDYLLLSNGQKFDLATRKVLAK